jgi:hypothetical protein
MRKTLAAAAATAVAFSIGATAGVAAAGSAYSSNGYFSVAGRSYYNYAYVVTDHVNNHKAFAGAGIVYRGGSNLPSGYMGYLPMRRSSTGALLCEGTYYYNSGPASGIAGPGCHVNYHSTYSSKGATRAWNGSAYTSVWTYLSPNQNN